MFHRNSFKDNPPCNSCESGNPVRLLWLIISIISICFVSSSNTAEWSDEQIETMAKNAEATVRQAFDFIWEYRLEIDLADTVRDPQRTGIIGVEYTSLTTTIGYIDAKEISIQPGWAAWLVRDFALRGLWPQANVAVSFSGSFPALNLAVLAALQELDCDVKGICSIGSSSWGANEIGLSWPEMERMLREEGILKVGCSAVTLGGTGDRGAEWNEYAIALAMDAVKRSRMPLLMPKNLRDAIKKRRRFYGDPADYACYINIGGNHASIGGGKKIRYHHGGWYYEPPKEKGSPNGVIDLFLKVDVPCLNLLYIEEMDKKYSITK